MNHIAISYRKQKKSEIGERILANVYETLEESAVDLTERAENALLLLANWKDLLTDLEEYDKAMEKAEIGVRLSLISERGDKLDTFVFEKGWCGLKKNVIRCRFKKIWRFVCKLITYVTYLEENIIRRQQKNL